MLRPLIILFDDDEIFYCFLYIWL